jgi:hypothetical protein
MEQGDLLLPEVEEVDQGAEDVDGAARVGAEEVEEREVLVRSLHRYGPKAVTGWIPRPGRGRPTKPWLVGPRRTVL